MVRRVGFGRSDEDARRPLRRRSVSSRIDAAADRDDAFPTEAKPPLIGRIFAGGFLLIWLTGWSAGIIFAATALISEWREGETFVSGFLALWLALALIGWVFAVRALLMVIRGERVRFRKRTGAAPSRPTFINREPDGR